MNEYVEILKRHIAENPHNYGIDANSILVISSIARIVQL